MRTHPLRDRVESLLAENDRVHLLGEALELSPATQGLIADHPDRVHLLPAADATLVGVAVGMALGGACPIVELSDAEALWGALQQLGQEGRLLCGGEFSTSMVVRVPIGPAGFDPTRLLGSVPGLTVVCASSATEAAQLLASAAKHSGPVVLLEPREVLGGNHGDESEPLPLGQARIVTPGQHATVLTWGAGVERSQQAAQALQHEGISLEVVDLRALQPLDLQTVGASVRRTGRVLVWGAPAGVVEGAVAEAFLYLESPPVCVDGTVEDLCRAVRDSVTY